MEAMDLYGPNGGMALLADFRGWAMSHGENWQHFLMKKSALWL